MQRRQLLTLPLLASALGCAQRAAPELLRIGVTGVEVFRIRVNDRGNWVIVRLQSDAGITGLGDASHAARNDPQVEWIREFVDVIKGSSVFETEHLRRYATPHYAKARRAVSCAMSAIEQAMYDIQAQAMGVPLHDLFGGALRKDIRNYANINRSTDAREPAGFAKMASDARDAGFTAIKMASFDGMPRRGSAAEIEAHTKLGIDCIRAVRDAIGPNADLLVDAHSNFDLNRGLDLLRRLEPLNLYWLEEVCRDLNDLRKIREAAPMPTAGGESLFGLRESLDYIKHDPVETLMPDVKYCGGMANLKKIGAMAEAAGMSFSPHGPASPVGNLTAAHVAATQPNFTILEYSFGDAPWRAELLEPPEPMKNGVLTLAGRPGLGFALNEKTAKARAV